MPCLRNAVTPIRFIFLLGAFVAAPAFGQTAAPCPALETTVTGPASANPGGTVAYTITIKNVGSCDATNVGYEADGVNGVVNPFLTFVSDSLNSPNDCSADGCFNTITPSLAQGATTTVTVNYKVGSLPANTYAKTVNFEQDFIASTASPKGAVDDSGLDAGKANIGAVTTPINTNKEAGCNSTGSAGGLLSLALMAVAALRRRTA